MISRRTWRPFPRFLLAVLLLGGCASGPPELPYPAFVDVNSLQNVFIAGLPGIRAKQLAGDPRTRRTGNQVIIPPDWQFSTGASPLQSVEIYVVAGSLSIGEFELTPGGYAYIPAGNSGFPMRSDAGAVMLYFLDAANEASVIQTPLITNSGLTDWVYDDRGVGIKELRSDPGSGARTWIEKIDPGGQRPWRRSSQTLEGYLLTGSMTESECFEDEAVTAEYLPGGYFYRPPGVISGGPESGTNAGAVWFHRVPATAQEEVVSGCPN